MGICNTKGKNAQVLDDSKEDEVYDLNYEIKQSPVVLYIEKKCKSSEKTIELFKSINTRPAVYDIAEASNSRSLRKALKSASGGKNAPFVFISGKFFGGLSDVEVGIKNHTVQKAINSRLESIGAKLAV